MKVFYEKKIVSYYYNVNTNMSEEEIIMNYSSLYVILLTVHPSCLSLSIESTAIHLQYINFYDEKDC